MSAAWICVWPMTSSLPKIIVVGESVVLKAVAYKNGVIATEVTEKQFVVHKATGKSISLTTPASPKYAAKNGTATLVNGVTGSTSYADGQWVGAEGTDLEALIDLGEPTEVSRVSVTSMNNRSNWVHHSSFVEVYGSMDGDIFEKLGEVADVASDDDIVAHDVSFETVTARYVKVHIHNRLIPEGFSGAGNPAWLFVDEIVVN